MMQKTKPTDKEYKTLRGLYAMSIDPQSTFNEKEIATIKLTRRLDELGLTLDDLITTTEERKIVYFSWKNETDKRIIFGSYAAVMADGKATIEWHRPLNASGRGPRPKKIGFPLTKAEAADMFEMVTHYTRLWENELPLMLTAFVAKHGLYDPNLSGKGKSLTSSEYEALKRRMAALQDSASPRVKRIKS